MKWFAKAKQSPPPPRQKHSNTVDGKNPATVDMVNTIIYRVLYMSGGAGFLPSAVVYTTFQVSTSFIVLSVTKFQPYPSQLIGLTAGHCSLGKSRSLAGSACPFFAAQMGTFSVLVEFPQHRNATVNRQEEPSTQNPLQNHLQKGAVSI